jgi:hypothetical protein
MLALDFVDIARQTCAVSSELVAAFIDKAIDTLNTLKAIATLCGR